MRSLLILPNLILIVLCFVSLEGLDNGLARTPPMGWMSWQRFRCITDCKLYPDDCISDKLFRKMADLMTSEGYLQAGYEYLIIDDCWMAQDRDAEGRLQPDPSRFPYGIKDLADYVHSKGLKFGMYQNFGNYTCAGYPGLMGHLEVDAKTFAEWEVDFLKIDGCYAKLTDYKQGYIDFGKYLNKTGRPIMYSCSWPFYLERSYVRPNYTLIAEVCNLWRNWGDIQDSYVTLADITKWFGKNQKRFASVAGPGNWNDPDMLIIGNFGLSYEQSKAQMAIWAVLAAPLLMSVDFRTIKAAEKEILLHKDVIAINQDELGIQGLLVRRISGIDVWVRPVTPVVDESPSHAIAFHSKRDDGHPYAIELSLGDIGLKHGAGYTVRNIYEPKEEQELLNVDEPFIVRVNPSGVVLLKATPVSFMTFYGYLATKYPLNIMNSVRTTQRSLRNFPYIFK